MPNNSDAVTTKRLLRSPRRLTLLASVAAIGLGAFLGSPASHNLSGIPGLVSAAQAEDVVQTPGFADLVARVKPAVISVRVQFDAARSAKLMKDEEQVQPGSPFDQFFRRFGFENGPNGVPQQTPKFKRNVAAEGSGFFISADGYAVTNNHVVENAKTVQVTTDAGKMLDAKVIGTDPKTDLALIKVEKIDGKDFPYVKFATHDPRIGDWVVAVGNPFGLGGTVTAGIVSARGRDIGAGPYDDYIQIDAPINKGNSGGPAFDLNGNVIGVNTAIFSPSGGSVGIGFDIPADTAKMVVDQIKEHGHVTRGWMGVQIQAVTPDIADSLGMKTAEGAIVDEPQNGSPAAKAGIVAGDVITAVDGKAIKDSRTLARSIAGYAPGTSVKLTVIHNGSEKQVSMTLGQYPEPRLASNGQDRQTEGQTPRLGLTLAPAADVDGAGSKGVAVTAVDPNGVAAEHGFSSGDVILEVAGKAVTSPMDVRQELDATQKAGKHAVLMRVKSGNNTKFVAVPLSKA